MASHRVEGVLLDVDGTLLDSNDAHAASWRDALAEQGQTVTVERLHSLIGMGADHLLPTLGLSDDDGPGKKAKARKGELFRERYLATLKPQPGARALVERFAREGVKRVVATSAKGAELERLLDAAGVRDLIDERATSSQAERSKPSPDIVQAAVERARIPPERLVMLGDTPYDVSAATRAGVSIVCVRCGGWNDADLAGAVAIYRDPADLLARYETSPFAGARKT
jgi:HAD superfamily hydrolase (TIGR01509 family)